MGMMIVMASCDAEHSLVVGSETWFTSKAGALCKVLHGGVQLHDLGARRPSHRQPLAVGCLARAASSNEQAV